MGSMVIRTPKLLRADGMSLHRQLAIVLRDEINRGTREPGGAFPTEEALCERFGVSRGTVRRALDDLQAGGFVYRRQGLGTFVCDQLPNRLPTMNLGLIDSLRKSQTETRAEVLAFVTELPPPGVGTLLQLSPRETALRVVRLRRVGKVPVMIADAWIPKQYSKNVNQAALRKKPLYELLLSHGIEFGRMIQETSAETADPHRASLLQTSIGAPLIRLSRLMHDRADHPVQHLTIHLSPERSRIVMDISSDKTGTLSAGYIAHDPKLISA